MSSASNDRGRLALLRELAYPRLMPRDLLPLIPAVLISFVVNFGFVATLILINEMPTHASVTKKVAITDGQIIADPPNNPDDDDAIIDRPDDIMPGDTAERDPDRIMPPDPASDARELTLPSDLGESTKPEVKGLNNQALPGLPGDPLENAIPGFHDNDGRGPIGQDSGRNSPGGGWQGGSFSSRGNPDQAASQGGGNDRSQRAVAQALAWLARHQNAGGYWSLDKYHQGIAGCRCKDVVFEVEVMTNDSAGAALGVLPFLAAGHTHVKKTPYRAAVFSALRYLLSKQDAKGDLGGGMYAHGIAAISLCEAYGMTQDVKLRIAAQNAIKFIAAAQNPQDGSWRYVPRSADGDASVVVWQVMALRSAQMAGLEVDDNVLASAQKYLSKCSVDAESRYSYQPGSGPTHSMTAAALLGRQYLGWGPRNPSLLRGCDFLLQQLPPAIPAGNEKLGPIYYHYYASQVLHNMGDKYWETWNPRMRDFLIRTQEQEGCKKGSWDPDGSDWGKIGGRLYSTALAVLTLEVYYRYLPLYRRGEAAAPANH